MYRVLQRTKAWPVVEKYGKNHGICDFVSFRILKIERNSFLFNIKFNSINSHDIPVKHCTSNTGNK